MWKIERIVSKGDYNYAVVPNHPRANKNGYVLEHRIVAENKLGRLLEEWEEVHHKDENKKNNRPDNLEVLTHAEHMARHAKRGELPIVCSWCGMEVIKRLSENPKSKGYKNSFCNRTCSGKHSRMLQIKNGINVIKTLTHGTRIGYMKFKCRCDICKKWNRERMKVYYHSKPS